MPEKIVRLRIDLADMRPPLWRRVEIAETATLDDVHDVIQAAMGWENCHLHMFETPLGRFKRPDPGIDDWGVPAKDSSGITLAKLIRQGVRNFTYTYDFGDDWTHRLRVEAVEAAAPRTAYPRLVKVVGRCPPEDCGGPWGYEELLDALANPGHERHAELRGWVGNDFDPGDSDEDGLRRNVARLAGRTGG